MRAGTRWFAGGAAAGVLLGAGAFVVAAPVGADTAERADLADTSPDPAVARFVDETAASGMRTAYDGGFTFFVGGGVATFDCNDDALPDVYVAGGENPAGLYRNTSALGGALSFEPVDDAASSLTAVTGAYPLDVDSDGEVDLAVLRVGENRLLRGLGDCRFTDATEQWDLPVTEDWTAAFSATWEPGLALPTVAVGNYLEVPPEGEVVRECASSYLVRPAPSGRALGDPVPLEPGLCTLSVLFHDWDGSGRADLRMANDRHYYTDGSEQLWSIEAGEAPRLYTEADGWQPMSIWGMGIAVADVAGDDRPEVVLTSQGDNKLQTLSDAGGAPSYDDIAIRAGTTAHRPFMGDSTFPSTAWHPQWADVNNDGHVDLYLSKGNVDAQGDHASDDPSNLLLARGDGTFVESARDAGVVSLGLGRGAAVVDLNADGMLDLIEVNRSDVTRVWRSVGSGTPEDPSATGSWLAVKLRQPAPNPDAVGAWVELRTTDGVQHQQVLVGGGHASGRHGWLHWGLGAADTGEVRVTWPDGDQTGWQPVDAGTFVLVERGEATVTVVEPGEEAPPRGR